MLQRRLKLDDEQKEQVEAIVAKRQIELMAIRREYQPKVTAELEQLRDEIGEVLTEPQRERWTQLFEELCSRWLPPVPPITTSDSEPAAQARDSRTSPLLALRARYCWASVLLERGR